MVRRHTVTATHEGFARQVRLVFKVLTMRFVYDLPDVIAFV